MDEWMFWNTDEDVTLDCVPAALCYRVWQERVRLKLSRAYVAQECGIGQQRIKSIEQGTGRYPDTTVIASLGVCGMDVSYILVGKRTQPLLRPDEAALVENYRNTSAENRKVLRKIGAALEKQVDDPDAAAASTSKAECYGLQR